MGIFLELIPKGKSSTLAGPALIDCTPTICDIKKATEMFAINNALLQCKPALNLPHILLRKQGCIHFSCTCHYLQLFHTDPNITSKTPAAFSATCFASIVIKIIGEVILIFHLFLSPNDYMTDSLALAELAHSTRANFLHISRRFRLMRGWAYFSSNKLTFQSNIPSFTKRINSLTLVSA